MTNLDHHEQSFTLDALELDPLKKDAISSYLANHHGKYARYAVLDIVNAWTTRCRSENALFINNQGNEPGDAWLITRITDSSRALHFFYRENSANIEETSGGYVYIFHRKHNND